MSESEDVDRYEDASSEMVREAKDSQRRKLWAVTFTSEVFQTLVDDQTTVCLGSTPPVSVKVSNVDTSSRTTSAKCADECKSRASSEAGALVGIEVILDLIVIAL